MDVQHAVGSIYASYTDVEVGAEDGVVQLVAGVGLSRGVVDVPPFLDRLRVAEAERVERRLGEGNAEVGVDRSAQVRRVVADAAHTPRLGVGDQVVASRRHVVTGRRRRAGTCPWSGVRATQQQQQHGDGHGEHPPSSPCPA